jgi:hypothetical protein
MPLACRATAGLSQGWGFDDGKPYSAHSPFSEVPAACGNQGREEALRRIPGLSPRTDKAAAEERRTDA